MLFEPSLTQARLEAELIASLGVVSEYEARNADAIRLVSPRTSARRAKMGAIWGQSRRPTADFGGFPGLLEPRKRAEQALVASVREAYVQGVRRASSPFANVTLDVWIASGSACSALPILAVVTA